MTKKKPSDSSDLSSMLDDLFAEAVEAVQKKDTEKSKPAKQTSSSTEFSEDDSFSIEVEIEPAKNKARKKDEISINLDDLFDDTETEIEIPLQDESKKRYEIEKQDHEENDDDSEEFFDSEESFEEHWKDKFLEMEIKYKKAKRAAAKRKNLIEEMEQTHNATRIELLQQKGHVERIQERLSQTQRQLRRYSDAMGMANEKIADLEERIANYETGQERQRKLLQKERDEQKKYGHGKSILQLISTLDNLKLALVHTGSDKEVLMEGVRLAVQKFENSLQKLGITQIDASLGTEFNPEIHEAMMKVPREDMPPNQIIDEIQSGFMIHDRLLRAARVSVSSRVKRTERNRTERNRTEIQQANHQTEKHHQQVEDALLEGNLEKEQDALDHIKDVEQAEVEELVEQAEVEQVEVEQVEVEQVEVEQVESESQKVSIEQNENPDICEKNQNEEDHSD